MFCPRCRAEYRTGFVRCNDCDVELVDQLAQDTGEPAHTKESDYVVVTTVQGPLEEGQISSFLEGSGIPTQVIGEGVRRVYGLTLNGMGAAQVLVPRQFAITAIDLLEKAKRGELQIDAEDDSKAHEETES